MKLALQREQLPVNQITTNVAHHIETSFYMIGNIDS